jgi:hypothetical protein
MKSVIFFFIGLLFLSIGLAKIQNPGLKGQLAGDGRFGYSGCGFGSMVFEPKEKQIFAMTLNHITSSQLFGMSSGTSNCYLSVPIIEHAENLPEFIEMNKEKLSADAAKGKGETLDALSVIIDCKPDEVRTTLKENYKRIFVETKMEAPAIEANINHLLQDNSKCF